MDALTEKYRYWLALARAPGVGPVTFNRIRGHFPELEEFFRAPGSWAGLSLRAESTAFLRAPDWPAVDGDLAWVEEPGHALLTADQPAYPRLLRELVDAPPILFVVGRAELLSEPQMAMVGSRNPTAAGREHALAFARQLAQAGLAVTSGLAQGIDAASHEGALAEGGVTIAVTGTGLDRVYPARNRALARRIAEQGALVSEFPPGTEARAENFPRRNRIISGLSLGVLVVEAALRSGSLITARLAAEQGREVFAIPGSLHNPLARGCHRLIREGAKLVETANDILEELGPIFDAGHGTPGEAGSGPRAEPAVPGLDREYEGLLAAMGYDPVSIDCLVERTGLTVEAVSSMLLMLELRGVIFSQAGGLYSRATSGDDERERA